VESGPPFINMMIAAQLNIPAKLLYFLYTLDVLGVDYCEDV